MFCICLLVLHLKLVLGRHRLHDVHCSHIDLWGPAFVHVVGPVVGFGRHEGILDPEGMGINSSRHHLGDVLPTVHFLVPNIHPIGKVCFHRQMLSTLHTFETRFVKDDIVDGPDFFGVVNFVRASLAGIMRVLWRGLEKTA